jgi:hypothetical protein
VVVGLWWGGRESLVRCTTYISGKDIQMGICIQCDTVYEPLYRGLLPLKGHGNVIYQADISRSNTRVYDYHHSVPDGKT